MVSSVDGKIAKPDNSISWFESASSYEKGVEGEDETAVLDAIDCYVMGAQTYQLALELSKDYGWAYGDKPTYVLSHQLLLSDRPNIVFYKGDLKQLIDEHLRPKYENVWVVGGAYTANDFIRQKLVDEIRISILPILLGEGLPFFDLKDMEQSLSLYDVKAYKNGMVELNYKVEKG